MRRLLALPLAAAVFATPAAAEPNACVPENGRAGVCVTVIECVRYCTGHVVVDPYCVPVQPYAGACALVDSLIVDLDNLPPLS